MLCPIRHEILMLAGGSPRSCPGPDRCGFSSCSFFFLERGRGRVLCIDDDDDGVLRVMVNGARLFCVTVTMMMTGPEDRPRIIHVSRP